MYRLNNTGRYTLITADEVIAKAPIMKDADVRLIWQNIEVAEERFIAPALGDDFYEALLELKNVTVTDTNKDSLVAAFNTSLTAAGLPTIMTLPTGSILNAIELIQDVNLINLWNRFLWRLVAECVDMMCTVPTWLRNTAAGQQKNNPETIGGSTASVTGDIKDIKFKMDKQLQDRIQPLMERMAEWICKNRTLYPLYTKCRCEDEPKRANGKGGIILGAYDEKDSLANRYRRNVYQEDFQDGWIEMPKVFGSTTPNVSKEDFVYRFTTVPGQTYYPLESDPDYSNIASQLYGAELIMFDIEGITLNIGNNSGEMQPKTIMDKKITWNDPAPADPGWRCILIVKKKP